MALKAFVDKTAFDAMPDAIKAEYRTDGDGYALDVDGETYADTGALRRARDREKQRAADAEAERDQLKLDLDETKQKKSRDGGDIATLEASWKAKADAERSRADKAEQATQAFVEKSHVKGVAEAMAKEISTVPGLMADKIAARLTVEMNDGEPMTRVLDAAGKMSAMSVTELRDEFKADKQFEAVMIGSKAAGGAGGNTDSKGGAPRKASSSDDVSYSDLSAAEKVAYLKEKQEAV